jgi:hypothetical protein
MLVIWFGLATSARRRSAADPDSSSRPWTHFLFWLPVATDWRPFDREGFERRVELRALPLGVVVTAFFIAPHWFLGLFTRGGADTSWALYDDGFRRSMLPVLIAPVVVRLVLCGVASFNAHLRARLDVTRFALWVCFVGLLTWTVLGWTLFASSMVDALFKVWLLGYLLADLTTRPHPDLLLEHRSGGRVLRLVSAM